MFAKHSYNQVYQLFYGNDTLKKPIEAESDRKKIHEIKIMKNFVE